MCSLTRRLRVRRGAWFVTEAEERRGEEERGEERQGARVIEGEEDKRRRGERRRRQ